MLPLLDVFMVVVFLFATIQEGTAKQLEEEAEAAAEAQAEAVASANRQAAAAEAARDRARDAAAKLKRQLAASREASPNTPDPRTRVVLERLLEKATVVEIEITGELTDDGEVAHQCCFRTDPRKPNFSSCGSPPTDAEGMQRWLDEAASLNAALRTTRGGAALTLIRQDDVAVYRIGARVADTIRALHPDRQVYAESPTELTRTCGGT